MFSSHPDLLVDTAKRIMAGKDGGFADLPEVKEVTAAPCREESNILLSELPRVIP